MTATNIRKSLQDLKVAEALIEDVKEKLQTMDNPRVLNLTRDLSNLEIALNAVYQRLIYEVVQAGLIE